MTVLQLHDEARDRPLPTTVSVPEAGPDAPLIVFCHGFWGHPRKFRRLLASWVEAGSVVAAPAFPRTNDESPPPYVVEDVANQPADVSFVLDELLARGLGAPDRIGVGGFSLGAETALAAGLHPRHADSRIAAVCAVAGGFFHPDFAGGPFRPLPLLLVHGTQDESVPYGASPAVADAATGPTELVTLQGAGHAICQDDAERYAHRVAEVTTAFWEQRFGRGGGTA